jgi:hypothetical protein
MTRVIFSRSPAKATDEKGGVMCENEEGQWTGKRGHVEGGKKDMFCKGKTPRVSSMVVDGQEIVITGGRVTTARLAEEWYQDVAAPVYMLEAIRKSKVKVDLFTFWQRLPETHPKYRYYMEWESIAALPITSFAHWWNQQINAKTRNVIRKAEKMGVVVKQAEFDQEFIRGMTDIFNETPIRQQKPFWHYGKDAETIKREFSRYLFREELFGAYYNEELIGFIFLAYAEKYALLSQIISKVGQRDKAPNNALMAKAVETCSQKNMPYLVYALWLTGGLGDFKRHNGFEQVDLPRYYVPLTRKGQIILNLRLHHGLVGIIPERYKTPLITLRRTWYVIKSASLHLWP